MPVDDYSIISTIELVDTQIPKISGSLIKQGSWVASWPFLERKWGLPNNIADWAIVHAVLKLTCDIHMVTQGEGSAHQHESANRTLDVYSGHTYPPYG